MSKDQRLMLILVLATIAISSGVLALTDVIPIGIGNLLCITFTYSMYLVPTK